MRFKTRKKVPHRLGSASVHVHKEKNSSSKMNSIELMQISIIITVIVSAVMLMIQMHALENRVIETPLSLIHESFSQSEPIGLRNSNTTSTRTKDKSNIKYRWDGDAVPDVPDAPNSPPKPEHFFRTTTINEKGKLKKMMGKFLDWQSAGKLIPCRLDEGGSCLGEIKSSAIENAINYLRSSKTTDTGVPRMILYNPIQEDRFWCGKRIWGGGTLEVTDIPDECLWGNNAVSLPYVHSKGPPIIPDKGVFTDNDIANPVELFWNVREKRTEPISESCSVPCLLYTDSWNILNTIRIGNTNWTMFYTMEGDKIYRRARVEPSAYKYSKFYATTSFNSEIPLPYFSPALYKIQNPAVNFDKVIKGASFLAKNCRSRNNREKVVSALIETPLRIDSLSGCLNNAMPLPGVDMKNKSAVMEQYLFHLSFENQNTDDYITEKLWGAFQSGTLPVYIGAKNIKEHVPRNSIIVAEDFDSPQELANYLIRLTNDKDLYESYHKWRYQTIDDAFTNKYDFTNTHSHCRMCKWVFAKRHGLGWNHSKQTVYKPDIDHKTCRNTMGLIGYPFKEYWLSPMLSSKGDDPAEESEVRVFSADATKSCTLNEENRVIEVDDGVIRRKVYDRDGVTDLIIDITTERSKNSNNFDHYTLRLEIPIKVHMDRLHVVSNSTCWIQDDQSRFYIMASGDTGIRLSIHEPGTIEIYIPLPHISNTITATKTNRVRIVTENLDHFHQDTEDVPSYFGELMMRDFFEPVASYQIQIS